MTPAVDLISRGSQKENRSNEIGEEILITDEIRDKMLQHITVPFHDNFVSNGVFTIVNYLSRYFLLTCYHCVKDYEEGTFLPSLNFLTENVGGSKWITPKVKACFTIKRKVLIWQHLKFMRHFLKLLLKKNL
ncbi:hypothetical protein [Metabacillus idriensis]|uniref:hypothetical protein n=1 Tax=Metabacillus idriensis TaxID=324768 RepID=UPI0017486863|nr:hypothetical protein [Metabacillus idriensis]